MKFSSTILPFFAISAMSVVSVPVKRTINFDLVPDFGLAAGLNPTGTGDCDGIPNAAGVPIKIPCSCPPPRDIFLASLDANVKAGHAVNNTNVAVSFPEDNSKASQLARIDTILVTLQNLNGEGKGCPASSTTFSAVQKAILALPDDGAAPASSAPVAASTPASSTIAAASTKTSSASSSLPTSGLSIDANLVPGFGLASGLNPTGTGDCDGIPNAAGVPIKIPCSCPPPRDIFLASLDANVKAGHAVNNTNVAVSFPEDNSKASQLARIDSILVTLQNLNGEGKGCPASSTTFSAVQKAILALPDDGATPASSVAPATSATSTKAPAATTAAAPATTSVTTSPGGISIDVIAALAPSLGFKSGVNPTGTGDCDGAVNGADGKPIKVPCTCPPSQTDYITALAANVEAGKILNNPTVPFSFPTDSSKASVSARIEAAITTLQNLQGPGKGCPSASTTLGAQQKAAAA